MAKRTSKWRELCIRRSRLLFLASTTANILHAVTAGDRWLKLTMINDMPTCRLLFCLLKNYRIRRNFWLDAAQKQNASSFSDELYRTTQPFWALSYPATTAISPSFLIRYWPCCVQECCNCWHYCFKCVLKQFAIMRDVYTVV